MTASYVPDVVISHSFEPWMDRDEPVLIARGLDGCSMQIDGLPNLSQFLHEFSEALRPVVQGMSVPFPLCEARSVCIAHRNQAFWNGQVHPLSYVILWLHDYSAHDTR